MVNNTFRPLSEIKKPKKTTKYFSLNFSINLNEIPHPSSKVSPSGLVTKNMPFSGQRTIYINKERYKGMFHYT